VIQVNPDWRKVLTSSSRYPGDLVSWVASRPEVTFYDIWDETIDPTWLPYLARVGGATRKQQVMAACAVARLCLPLIPEWEDRPRVAIETIEAWCRDEATAEQVREAASTLAAAADSNSSSYYASASAAAYYASTPAYSTSSAYYALRAGIEHQLICSTYRKHLVFERSPRPKGLTIWQRLAKEEE